VFKNRITLLLSPINKLPLLSATMPCGLKNVAALPIPLAEPETPVVPETAPAIVDTAANEENECER
jgi:hypothetical protein